MSKQEPKDYVLRGQQDSLFKNLKIKKVTMRRIILIVTVILITIILSGCATTNYQLIMESWLGHHKSELIRSWGPADRVTSDGDKGQILIYEQSTTNAVTFNNLYGIDLVNPITTVNTRTNYQYFYVDNKGIIYYVKWGTN